MSKTINLDKFYTPIDTAKYCINLAYKYCKNITEIIEPSAGSGAFSNQIKNCIAYDLVPEHDSIIKHDFLKLNLPYKSGRLIIGNPPFGNRNNLSRSFYKHSVKLGDYVAFILPISQLNNVDSLFEFDLINSVDLGVLRYSDMAIHCCFNIYNRPHTGKLNKKPKLSSNLFKIYRDDQAGYNKIKYDLCIFRRGASAGKEKLKNQHTQTYKIKVFDKLNLDFVKNTILNFNWKTLKIHQSAQSISKNDIYRLFI